MAVGTAMVAVGAALGAGFASGLSMPEVAGWFGAIVTLVAALIARDWYAQNQRRQQLR